MKHRPWISGAVVAAGIVALVAPAVGQGKTASTGLRWSTSRGGPALPSYDVGGVDGGARATKGFRLGNSLRTKSGPLAISLAGSSAFTITKNHCTRKSIGKKLSCWIGVAYAPLRGGTNDKATLTATGPHSAAASLSLSGCSRSGQPNHVYWAEGGRVNAVPAGGGCVTILARGEHYPESVAVSGAHVYWINDRGVTGGGEELGTVDKVSVGGGSVTTLATDHPGPCISSALAVDGEHVYWADFWGGTVNEIPVGGGPVTTLASGQLFPCSVAVDGTHVYWSDLGDEPDGSVNEVPIGGGGVTTLATHQNIPLSVAVDGTHVYWVDQFGNPDGYGTVNEVPLGGGSVTTLATGASLFSVATDGTNVYWVDFDGGTVNEVPVGGGTVTTLARNHPGASSVAADGAHVYWTDWYLDGAVNEVPVGGGSVTVVAPRQSYPDSVAVGR